jgi:hypothetical protein
MTDDDKFEGSFQASWIPPQSTVFVETGQQVGGLLT